MQNISALGFVVQEEMIFEVFLYKLYVKSSDPWGRANLTPGVMIWTILVEVYPMMLHAKYLSSGPYGSGEEDF